MFAFRYSKNSVVLSVNGAEEELEEPEEGGVVPASACANSAAVGVYELTQGSVNATAAVWLKPSATCCL